MVKLAAETALHGWEAVREPPPDELDAYMHLSREEVARLVLCLLIEEALKEQLAFFRSHDLPTKPVQG